MRIPDAYKVRVGSHRTAKGLFVTGRSVYVKGSPNTLIGRRFGTHSEMMRVLTRIGCIVFDGRISDYRISTFTSSDLLALGFDPLDFADPSEALSL